MLLFKLEFIYSKCSLFIWRSDCLKQAVVERFCTLVNNYEWLFKRISRLFNVLFRLVKWTTDCFVFLNNGEKLCHFVKIKLQKGVRGLVFNSTMWRYS